MSFATLIYLNVILSNVYLACYLHMLFTSTIFNVNFLFAHAIATEECNIGSYWFYLPMLYSCSTAAIRRLGRLRGALQRLRRAQGLTWLPQGVPHGFLELGPMTSHKPIRHPGDSNSHRCFSKFQDFPQGECQPLMTSMDRYGYIVDTSHNNQSPHFRSRSGLARLATHGCARPTTVDSSIHGC